MAEHEFDRFSVRLITRSEWDRHLHYTKSMLFASAAASLAIVGAGAFFLALWF